MAASRVIEIDDVLVPRIACSAKMRADGCIDLALDAFVLDGGFDDEIAIRQFFIGACSANARQSGIALGFGQFAGLHAPGEIAVDGGEARLDALRGNIVERDVIAGKGANMGDAVAHLTGANDADFRDSHFV